MKILFIGDIVGSVGREVVRENLPKLKEQYQIDLVIGNGENAAHGKGITKKIYRQLLSYGIDIITWGIILSQRMIYIHLLMKLSAWFALPIWNLLM